MFNVTQVIINDASDKTITGVIIYDRLCGGALSIPSGTSFPSSPTYPGEIFWRTDESILYRRNDANTTWEPITTTSITIPGASHGSLLYYNGTSWVNLSPGTDGYFLQTHGVGNAPSWENHDSLRRLIHLADGSGPFEGFVTGTYREILPTANPFPTSITWWTSPLKTQKIVEKLITYNANKTISTIIWKSYDTDGVTVLNTVTDTINYSGVIEINRTRNIV